MPELKLVRTFDQIKDDVIRDLRTDWKSISALVRKHGLDRNIIVDLQKRFDPDKKHKNIVKGPRISRKPIVEVSVERSSSQWWRSLDIRIVAWVLGLCGAVLSGLYGYSIGITSSKWAAYLTCAIFTANDLFTMLLPSKAATLWHQKCRLRSGVAWLMLLVCISLTFLATFGFFSTTIGDHDKYRAKVETRDDDLTERKEALKAQLKDIKTTVNPDALDNRIQIALNKLSPSDKRWSNNCMNNRGGRECDETNRLRAEQDDARRRDKLMTLLQSTSDQLSALEAVSSGNPASTRELKIFQLIGISSFPLMAGLALLLAGKITQ